MKVILHNAATDLYFIGPNMWTNDRSKAFDFERMEHAMELAAHLAGLKDLELVVSFPNIPDVCVPVNQPLPGSTQEHLDSTTPSS